MENVIKRQAFEFVSKINSKTTIGELLGYLKTALNVFANSEDKLMFLNTAQQEVLKIFDPQTDLNKLKNSKELFINNLWAAIELLNEQVNKLNKRKITSNLDIKEKHFTIM